MPREFKSRSEGALEAVDCQRVEIEDRDPQMVAEAEAIADGLSSF